MAVQPLVQSQFRADRGVANQTRPQPSDQRGVRLRMRGQHPARRVQHVGDPGQGPSVGPGRLAVLGDDGQVHLGVKEDRGVDARVAEEVQGVPAFARDRGGQRHGRRPSRSTVRLMCPGGSTISRRSWRNVVPSGPAATTVKP